MFNGGESIGNWLGGYEYDPHWADAYQKWVDGGIAKLVPESKENIGIADRTAVVLGLLTSPVSVPLALLAGCDFDYVEDSYVSEEDIEIKPETASLGMYNCKANPQDFEHLDGVCGTFSVPVTAKDIASCLNEDISTSEPTKIIIGLDYKANADTCYESPNLSVLVKGKKAGEFPFSCNSFGTSSLAFCVPAGTALSDITLELTSGDWCSSVLFTSITATKDPSCAPPVPTQPVETKWIYNGFVFTAYQSDQYCNPAFFDLVQDAWLVGADTIGLLYTRYQDDLASTEIKIDDTKTPSLDSLSCAIDTIQGYGMKVALYLYVNVEDESWRADIAPTSESAWFDSFQAYLTEMSGYASDQDVDLLSVGSELHSMTKVEHLGQWQKIVGAVRDNYNGTVLYFPDQNNFNSLDMGYWQLFDAVGINLWPSLSNEAVPTTEALVEAWMPYVVAVTKVADVAGKEIFVGEGSGYPSREYCAKDPWNCGDAGTHSDECQSNAYKAFYQVWGKSDQVMGVLFWQVGLGDKGYDPNMCDPASIGCCPMKQSTEAVIDSWM